MTASGRKELKAVTVWCDGACKGNPGPGGYGAILLSGDKRKELSAGYRRTTNNRMEMLGLIISLETLKFPCRVTVYSDSKYVVDSLNLGYPRRWRQNGWKLADKKPAKNVDLWQRLLDQVERHQVELHWVKGHAGTELNEAVDQLANLAIKNTSALLIDEAFEKETDLFG
ncbi:MAG: ribonuclease h [Verrucomicrobiota bacterium]|jgi:ribonuclease HI